VPPAGLFLKKAPQKLFSDINKVGTKTPITYCYYSHLPPANPVAWNYEPLKAVEKQALQ